MGNYLSGYIFSRISSRKWITMSMERNYYIRKSESKQMRTTIKKYGDRREEAFIKEVNMVLSIV